MAKLEREIGNACIKENIYTTDCDDNATREGRPVFLDELAPDRGDDMKKVMPECGIFCQVEFAHIMDPLVDQVMSGEKSISKI